MTTPLLQQALEALEDMHMSGYWQMMGLPEQAKLSAAITAIRAHLEEPKGELVPGYRSSTFTTNGDGSAQATFHFDIIYPAHEWYERVTDALASPPSDTVSRDEGCTQADAKVLRAANHALAEDNERLRAALRFYAAKQHFNLADPDAWDTVSGEPQNFWCDEAGTATMEDGTLAACALRGTPIDWEDDPPPLCPGEPEDLIARAAMHSSTPAVGGEG